MDIYTPLRIHTDTDTSKVIFTNINVTDTDYIALYVIGIGKY